jgi:hypothetical protein
MKMRKVQLNLLLFICGLQFCSLLGSFSASAKPSINSVAKISGNSKNGMNRLGARTQLLFPVLVRGLEKFAEEDVKDLFVDCGEIGAVHRSSSGKWFIYFADKASAALGQMLNGTDFEVIGDLFPV